MIETADDQVARERLNVALEADSSGEALQFDEELQRQLVKSRPMRPAERQTSVPFNSARAWFWRAYLLMVAAAVVWAFKS